MLYLNYEEAQAIMGSDNLIVVRSAVKLHHAMLASENIEFRPSQPFDMCYFYDSAIRIVAEHVRRPVDAPLLPHGAIVSCKPPDLTSPEWRQFDFVKLGLADNYVSQVQNATSPEGVPFDLTFACAIACRAFDSETLAWIASAPPGPFAKQPDDFEHWLEGFNAAP